MSMSYALTEIYEEVFGGAEQQPGPAQIPMHTVNGGFISTQTTMTQYRIFFSIDGNLIWATQVTANDTATDVSFEPVDNLALIPEDIKVKLGAAMKSRMNEQPLTDKEFYDFIRESL